MKKKRAPKLTPKVALKREIVHFFVRTGNRRFGRQEGVPFYSKSNCKSVRFEHFLANFDRNSMVDLDLPLDLPSDLDLDLDLDLPLDLGANSGRRDVYL